MVAWLRRHARILSQYMRIGLVRKSQFRVDFLSQILMDIVWNTIHILVFEVLYLHTDSIVGWTRADIRVFLGFLFVSDAFMMTFLGSAWRFGRDLKDGKLDPFRVRPASTSFLYFFQLWSLEGAVNSAIASGFLGWALWRHDLLFDPMALAFTAWGVAVACWARLITLVLFSIPEFFLLSSDLARFLFGAFNAPIDRPLDIFGRRIRQVLLYVIPVGAMTYFPAALVLGKSTVSVSAVATLWLAALGGLIFWAWKRCFRTYESALG